MSLQFTKRALNMTLGWEHAAMPPSRRITEVGLTVELDHSIMMEPRALRDSTLLPEIIEYANNCHLYIIGHRPMTVVDPHSLTVDGNLMAARFISRVNSEEAIIECTWAQPGVEGAVRIDTEWPHNILKIYNSTGQRIARGNASYFLTYAMGMAKDDQQRLPVDIQFLDLAVDYVGKAYGTAGARGAFTRLQSHKTLQRILAELPRDSEPWLILLDSDKQTIFTTIVPSGAPGDEKDLDDDDHISRSLGSAVDYSVIVDLVEGCLIKYFQPSYNIQLKESFPRAAAKPLAELYARDLNMVGFDLDTRHLGVRLCSANSDGSLLVEPDFEHSALYPLHDATTRKNMFDFIDDIDVLRLSREGTNNGASENT